ncbi:GNAT family N-acetyltransferase [Arthrobacter sp. NPDC090010]|uniref:GNAT family N-acetyltransferase n=1 Tax=Arthrobacter sp. NPDC090010 TaxID=3363942 RepID=UPI0037FB7658
MEIRRSTDDDWPEIFGFYREIIDAGRSYAFPAGQTLEEARPWWMENEPGRTVVATDGLEIVGSAKMGPNRPGRGAHIATASFLVSPRHGNRGIGRLLGEHVLEWARGEGYHGMQFNAVVESNHPAVHLWQALGFRIIGTVPEAFEHPDDGLVGLHVMYQKL